MSFDFSPSNDDFGCAMLLYAKSNLHAAWSIAMASNYVLPALKAKQFLILKSEDGMPLGYVSWAFLDIEREAKYLHNPHSLSFDDWNSGDRLWFMDCVSPASHVITQMLLNHLRVNIFPTRVARALRLKLGRNKATIKSYGGCQISPKERCAILIKYYLEIKGFMDNDSCKINF